jgi:hypothetical protein
LQFRLCPDNSEKAELWVLLTRHKKERDEVDEFISLHAFRDSGDEEKSLDFQVVPRTPVEAVCLLLVSYRCFISSNENGPV